jgi:hypothetical protein
MYNYNAVPVRNVFKNDFFQLPQNKKDLDFILLVFYYFVPCILLFYIICSHQQCNNTLQLTLLISSFYHIIGCQVFNMPGNCRTHIAWGASKHMRFDEEDGVDKMASAAQSSSSDSDSDSSRDDDSDSDMKEKVSENKTTAAISSGDVDSDSSSSSRSDSDGSSESDSDSDEEEETEVRKSESDAAVSKLSRVAPEHQSRREFK